MISAILLLLSYIAVVAGTTNEPIRSIDEACSVAEDFVYGLISSGYNATLPADNQACRSCTSNTTTDELVIDCGFAYCEECDMAADTCAQRSLHFTFLLSRMLAAQEEDLAAGSMPVLSASQCVHFTEGAYEDTVICEETHFFPQRGCEFSVNGDACKTCLPDPCDDGSRGIGGDCRNLEDGQRFSTCPESQPFIEQDSPYFIFRSDTTIKFATCFDPDALAPTSLTPLLDYQLHQEAEGLANVTRAGSFRGNGNGVRLLSSAGFWYDMAMIRMIDEPLNPKESEDDILVVFDERDADETDFVRDDSENASNAATTRTIGARLFYFVLVWATGLVQLR